VMERLVNLLRGSVRVKIEGARGERFLNVCSREGIEFWQLERVSEAELRVSVHASKTARVLECARRAGFEAEVLKRSGAPFAAKRIKGRWVMAFGLLFCWALVWVSSLFVWEIEVYGSENVSSAEIKAAVEKAGVRFGTFGPSISQEDVRSIALLELPQLAWLTVNFNGSRAEIIVRERVEKPEMLEDSKPADIVAAKSGIITEQYVCRGQELFKAGDTVLAGEKLVSGVQTNRQGGQYRVHAVAQVYARTWYELSARIPAVYYQKRYTGENIEYININFMGNRTNLYFTGRNPERGYDIIYQNRSFRLSKGLVLPAALEKTVCREYELVPEQMPAEQARALLERELTERLKGQIDGEIVSSECSVIRQGDIFTVTLRAECLEQIGKTAAIDAAEGEAGFAG